MSNTHNLNIISVSQLLAEVQKLEQSGIDDRDTALAMIKASHELNIMEEQTYYLKRISQSLEKQTYKY